MFRKSKRKTVQAKDRLSSLPDKVLWHILSFLITKEAVSTSVLSTRWRSLYTNVTVLSFVEYFTGLSEGTVTGRTFAEFIKGVFNRHVSDISLFLLVLTSGSYDLSDVNSWINASLRRNVRKIKVMSFLEAVSRCPFPTEIFSCKTLVDLELEGSFVFNVPETVDIPKLKNCYLGGCIEFVSNSSGRLFLSFPKLEDLTLKDYNLGSIMDLELHLPFVKVVRFSMVYGDGANKILLVAPNIEAIECYYHMANVLFKDAVKFMRRADVGFDQESSNSAEAAKAQLLKKNQSSKASLYEYVFRGGKYLNYLINTLNLVSLILIFQQASL